MFGDAQLLARHTVQYFRCQDCGFIQTEEPYWLEEAYSQKITDSDIGLVDRNLRLAMVSRALISIFFNAGAKFLDYGGGYGLFVRLMRDAGYDFYLWDKYASINLFAKGFEAELSDHSAYELVTAFEVFEHLVAPLEDIETMLACSRNIFFSTVLVPPEAPKLGDWWYYGLEHGQHVSFYSRDSLVYLAKRFNLNFISNGGSLHFLTERKISPLLFKLILWGKVHRLFERLFVHGSFLIADYNRFIGRKSSDL